MSKRNPIFTTVIALCGALSFACDAPSDAQTDTTLSDVREKSAEAIDSLNAYASEQRAELESRTEAAFDELASEVDEARRALAELPADVEEEARETLEASIERAEAIQKKATTQLEKSKRVTQEHWEVAQTRLEATIEELAEARREIVDALSGEELEASS